AFLAMTALHHGWWGGYSTGPRYLVPALPLLVPFAARAFERWPKLASALAAISFANAVAIAAVSVSVHELERNPLRDDIWPGLVHGVFGRTSLAAAAGAGPRLSVATFALIFAGLVAALTLQI